MQANDIFVPLPHFDALKWPQAAKTLQLFSSGKLSNPSEFLTHLISLYNLFLSKENQISSLKALSIVFEKNKHPELLTDFFTKTLPFIGKLALEITELFPKPLPFFLQNKQENRRFSKKQVACLVAHMFLGTITKNDENENTHELFSFQFILATQNNITIEKIYFLLNYFRRLETQTINLDLTVEYARIAQEKRSLDEWRSSKTKLLDVSVLEEGGIEDFYSESIQVDFANKFIGGGALFTGCVQEEIRFIISPECLPSMIMFECLKSNEAAFIIGAEQVCSYQGYAWTLKYGGDFRDTMPKLDSHKRMDVNIVALDAICFFGGSDKSEQYQKEYLLRELNKAYIGFQGDEKLLAFEQEKGWISTGRWGCGAFNGCSQLKFMIQWLAASEAGKRMRFYRKGDCMLYYAEEVGKLLEGKTVGETINLINKLAEREGTGRIELFKEILKDGGKGDLEEIWKTGGLKFTSLVRCLKK